MQLLRVPNERSAFLSKHPESSNELIILGHYTDALRVSIQGMLREDKLKDLWRAKDTSHITLEVGTGHYFAIPGLPDGPLQLQAHSRDTYEHVLESKACYLEVTQSSSRPSLLLQFRSWISEVHLCLEDG